MLNVTSEALDSFIILNPFSSATSFTRRRSIDAPLSICLDYIGAYYLTGLHNIGYPITGTYLHVVNQKGANMRHYLYTLQVDRGKAAPMELFIIYAVELESQERESDLCYIASHG